MLISQPLLYQRSRSARGHSQCILQVLVHHIANADCWNDLHEVWAQAPVQPHGPFCLDDLFEKPRHGYLLAASQSSCKREITQIKQDILGSYKQASIREILMKGERDRHSDSKELTLSLHAGAHKSQWVAGQLTTCAGDGATCQQNEHTRVSAVCPILLQPGVF